MLRSLWEPELETSDLIPLYCMWIRALCDTVDLDHALTLAERAADEFPREIDVLIALGNVLDLRGELERARDVFAKAIVTDPTGSLQHYNLGAVLERLGDEEGAEASYREAVLLDSEMNTLLEASAALGALLRRTGRLEDAARVYEAYLDEDPINVDILVEHGICLSDLDSFSDATERFELALSLEREHPGAWYNLAITQYRMGLHADALASMERARQADPGNPLTLAVLGSWHLALRPVGAEGALRPVGAEGALRPVGAEGALRPVGAEGFSLRAGTEVAVPHECAGPTGAELASRPTGAELASRPTGAELDEGLRLVYGALDLLAGLDDHNLSPGYASLVCEEVFEALWQRGGRQEAREVARMAGQRDWITAHMLNTLNEADHGRAPQVTAFTVTARAEAGEAPEHWPDNARGYTTGLTVLAANEDEARRYSLEYLRSIEPYPSVHFHIEMVRPGGTDDVYGIEGPMQPRARGVVGVTNARAYFRP